MGRRRDQLVQAVIVAACVSSLGGHACSRTNDPVEHHPTTAGPGRGPGGGGAPGSGAAGTSRGGSTSSSGSPATAKGGATNGGSGDRSSGGSSAASGGTGDSASGGSSNESGGTGNRSAGGSSNESGGTGNGASGGTMTASAGEAGSGTEPVVPTDFGCGGPPVTSGPFTRRDLRSAATDCALHHYCRFEGAASILEAATTAYAAEPGPETLAKARAAFAQAMSTWSVAELFQFGPAASRAVSSGKDIYQGQGLRELIHSWPLTVRCRVEEQVAVQNYEQDLGAVLISGRGLFGLEYLLHYEGSDTACTASSTAGKAWATLDGDELASRKRAYAAVLGADVTSQVRALRTAWAADGGNFRPVFVEATGYPDDDKAMTVLAWSLLYIEREVKDWKLGIPAGYTATSPVTLAESPYSGLGTENVRANLRGFRALFQGCGADGEGLGFDDWLSEAGHGELAADIIAAWQDAQAEADAYPRFADATPARLETLYRKVKALTDLLKTELFGDGSPIGLDLPEGLSSDTD